MKRKIISAFFFAVALLMAGTILAAAQGSGQDTYQMDMATPTPTLVPAVTPLSGDLPLAAAQSGTCPMMSGSGMTATGGMSGMGMNGMSGMQGMSGMNMGNMSGMQNMPGGTTLAPGASAGVNMGGMAGMNTMSGPMYSTPWYNNPWLMLGWVLLVLVLLALLAGIVLAFQRISRRSKVVAPIDVS